MKRLLSQLLIVIFACYAALSYADVTIKKDQQGQALGRFEVVRFLTGASNCTPTTCTGGSGQVYSNLTGLPSAGGSGETIVVDLTNPTGINWSSTNALGAVSVNLPAGGINWNYFQPFSNNTIINWQAVTGYNGLAEASANWSNMAFPSSGINWTGSGITNNGINWQDIINTQNAQGTTTGINWTDINPVAGGINWLSVSSGSASQSIVCWKAGGNLGHCQASFSSSGAGTCACQ